jgi:tRNA(Leu) C34 or U34 (ribose-2'-O)-methylase TrmL
MKPSAEVKVSKLDAGSKRTWKLHQTVDELQKWSVYLHQSTERFLEEFTGYNSRSIFVTTPEKKAYQDVMNALLLLKKESSLMKSRSRRLHGPRL